MWEAAKEGDILLLQQLIKGGTDVNQKDEKGRTPLIYATHAGHHETIKFLLSKHAHPHTESDIGTPLVGASYGGHVECIKEILKYGVEFNYLAKVKINKNNNIVMEETGEKTWGDDITALIAACHNGHADCVEVLLKNNADPNVEKQAIHKGATALIRAASRGHVQCVKLLLQYGAKPGHKTKKGVTALENSMKRGHKEVAEVICRHLQYGRFVAVWLLKRPKSKGYLVPRMITTYYSIIFIILPSTWFYKNGLKICDAILAINWI